MPSVLASSWVMLPLFSEIWWLSYNFLILLPYSVLPQTHVGGGTHSYQKEQTVCELRSDEGIRFFKDGCCGTLRTIDGCGDKCVIERIICASRGRNPTNPSDRTVGAPTEQRLEPNSQGICNTLTSVAKDNYVLEIRTVDDG